MNLENLGVQEMSADEAMEIEGGFFWLAVGACATFIAVMYLTDVAANLEQHKDAFMEGYDMAKAN